MDLIYLYPNLNDAPAKVGKSILEQLVYYQKNLPFENIKLISLNKNLSKNDNTYLKNLKLITFWELLTKEDYVVHIPLSPNVFPNKKFLLNLLCLIKGTPLIVNYHGDIRKYFLTKLKYEKKVDLLSLPSVLLIPFFLRKSTIIVTNSYFLNDFIAKKYCVNNSVVIPNGIDDFWFQPPKDQVQHYFNNIDPNNYKVFYHGRLSPEKGVDLLIKAMGIYIRENPKTTLYISGNGSQRTYLQELSLNLGIADNIIFLGETNKETIKFFLENVNVAIYPSIFDGFCLAVLEALACANCPVCFSENAGIYDFVVKEKSKLIHFKPTIENIIYALKTIDSSDNKETIMLQKEFAKEYNWKNIARRYIDLYWSLVSR